MPSTPTTHTHMQTDRSASCHTSFSATGSGCDTQRPPVPQSRTQRSSASIAFCGRSAGLRFAVTSTSHTTNDNRRGDISSAPTVVMLTQNIGGIEAASSPAEEAGAGLVPTTSVPAPEDLCGNTATSTATMSTSAPMALAGADGENDGDSGPTPCQSFWLESASDAVLERTKTEVAEFIADLRGWLHRLAVLTERRRRRQQAEREECCGNASQKAATKEKNDGAEEEDLAAYRTTDIPPLIDVVVIHFQEIGGKYMNEGFNTHFAAELKRKLLPEAGWTSGLLIDTVPHAEGGIEGSPTSGSDGTPSGFTAIGSIVFLSPSMMAISSMLSFPHLTYIPVADDPCSYGGSARNVFHAAKFRAAGRSRKGFMLLSMRLGTCVMNTCNVHLFNDDDNVQALKKSPSVYVARRTDALLEAIAESLAVVNPREPFFVFGDCNTRVDGKLLAEHLLATQCMELVPGKKSLRCPESFWALFYASEAGQQQLRRQFDLEPRRILDAVAQACGMELAEMPFGFAPTYSRVAETLTARLAAHRHTQSRQQEQQQTRSVNHGGGGGAGARRGGREPAARRGEVDNNQQHAGKDDAATQSTRVGSSDEGGEWAIQSKGEDVDDARSAAFADVVADRSRDNFAHTRVPAWCDRLFFNPAGMEMITGACFDPEATGDGVGKAYMYEAVSLLHTDHDGVFLAF